MWALALLFFAKEDLGFNLSQGFFAWELCDFPVDM